MHPPSPSSLLLLLLPRPQRAHAPTPSTQMTAAQLAAQREREQRQMAEAAAEKASGLRRMVSEDDYAAAIEVSNRNRWVARAAGQGERLPFPIVLLLLQPVPCCAVAMW